MKIQKGTKLSVKSNRKGNFEGVAYEDFDTDDEWYSIAVSKGNGSVKGLTTIWNEGEKIPCRKGLCTIKIIE